MIVNSRNQRLSSFLGWLWTVVDMLTLRATRIRPLLSQAGARQQPEITPLEKSMLGPQSVQDSSRLTIYGARTDSCTKSAGMPPASRTT